MAKKAIKKPAVKTEKTDKTAYLLSTKANRKALAASIKQLEKGEIIAFSSADKGAPKK